MTQAKPHSHMGPAKPIHHSRDARLRPNPVFVNATACDLARAARACMQLYQSGQAIPPIRTAACLLVATIPALYNLCTKRRLGG